MSKDGWGVYEIEVVQTSSYSIIAPSREVAQEYADFEGSKGLTFEGVEVSAWRSSDIVDFDKAWREVDTAINEDQEELSKEELSDILFGADPEDGPCKITLPLFGDLPWRAINKTEAIELGKSNG